MFNRYSALIRGSLATPLAYKPPVRIEVVGKTDFANLRMGYGVGELIFNWEAKKGVLYVMGGPLPAPIETPGVGFIPVDRFVTITLTVLKDRMLVAVDGQERAEIPGDFSKVDEPVRIYTGGGSTLTLTYVGVTPLEVEN